MAQSAPVVDPDRSARVFHVSAPGHGGMAGIHAQGRHLMSINAALAQARPGDVIHVGPGVYREHVRITRSGTADKPITLVGAGRGRTIIDPSLPAPAAWARAPEAVFRGHNVWRTQFGFRALALFACGRSVTRLLDNTSQSKFEDAMTAGFSDRSWPAPAPPKGSYEDEIRNRLTWWDGLGAIFAQRGTYTYLAFADPQADPVKLRVRASANGGNQVDAVEPALRMHRVAFNIVKSMTIRGAYYGVSVRDGAHGNQIVDVAVEAANTAIGITGAGTHRNRVSHCHLCFKPYGQDVFGAWTGDMPRSRDLILKHAIYRRLKLGAMFRIPRLMRIAVGAHNNEVRDCILESCQQGILIAGVGGTTLNTRIEGNTIRRISLAALFVYEDQRNTVIARNLIYDAEKGLRLQNCERDRMQNPREVFVRRNRMWNPFNVGDHIFVHHSGVSALLYPALSFDHNSVSGGRHFLNYNRQMPKVTIENNILSSRRPLHATQKTLGRMRSNWIDRGLSTLRWAQNGNVIRNHVFWDPLSLPDFRLSSAHSSVRRVDVVDQGVPLVAGPIESVLDGKPDRGHREH